MNRDGMIDLDSDFARQIGFTSDKFEGYGWVSGTCFHVSLIISKNEGAGNFRAMVDRLLQAGYTVKVPTPSMRMRTICKQYGFMEKIEHDPEMGPCEIMEKTL